MGKYSRGVVSMSPSKLTSFCALLFSLHYGEVTQLGIPHVLWPVGAGCRPHTPQPAATRWGYSLWKGWHIDQQSSQDLSEGELLPSCSTAKGVPLHPWHSSGWLSVSSNSGFALTWQVACSRSWFGKDELMGWHLAGCLMHRESSINVRCFVTS